MKRGRLSSQEIQTVLRLANKQSVEEIARKLDRKPSFIQKCIDEHTNPLQTSGDTSAPQEKAPSPIKSKLRASATWRRLKNELSSDELRYFEEEYVKLMVQFKEDVYDSEEYQIHNLIRFDILMHRILSKDKRDAEEMERLDRIVKDKTEELKDNFNEDDRGFLDYLESQVGNLRAARRTNNADYIKLEEKHQDIMRSLKATREQRITRAENSKANWLGIIRQLQDAKVGEAEGRHMQVMEKATQAELNRLSALHTYGDGEIDQPVLNADTVVGEVIEGSTGQLLHG